MWEYKVVAGRYSVEGGDVVVENQLGRGTLQRVLDHYSGEGYELMDTNFDNLNKEVILTLRKPRGGVSVALSAAPVSSVPHAAPPAQAPAASFDEDELPRRRKPAAGGKRRRSKAELDRLYRDS